jgi:uncharacterized membrane protein (UPF0127 family)
MKWLRLLVVGGIIGLGASTFIKMSAANPMDCASVYRRDTTVKAGSNYIDAEVAKDNDQKEAGLGNRDCIGADKGMLFVFDKPGNYDFWMKDMKFPIDIVWINENKTTVEVTPSVSPSTFPKTFTSKVAAKYVLELQSGRAQQLNISEGTNLQFDL